MKFSVSLPATGRSPGGRRSGAGCLLARRPMAALLGGGAGAQALCRRRFLALGERGEPRLADLAQLALMLDLQAEDVLDVEDVDDLLAIGRDLGARDLQIEPGERPRQLEEETGPAAAIDLDDGVRRARLVVDEDARRHREDAGPADEGGRLRQLAMRLQPPGQPPLEIHGET